MSIIRKLGSQTFIYGLSSILGRLINWMLTPLYAHCFTLEEFGIFSDLYSLTFFPLIILTFGMETSFFHFVGKSKDHCTEDMSVSKFSSFESDSIYSAAFTIISLFSTLFCLIAGVFYNPIADILGYSSRSEMILLLVFIITADVLAALPMAKLRHEEKAGRFAFISLTNIGITLSLNIFFVSYMGWGVESVLAANLIASLIKLILASWKALPKIILNRVDFKRIANPMLQYGALIMIAGCLGAINETFDKSLLPRVWGDDPQKFEGKLFTGMQLNGIYGAMYKIGMFISLLTQAFRYAAEPFFFKEASQKDAPLTYARVFHYFTTFCLIGFLFVASMSFEILSFNGFGLFKSTLIPSRYWIGLDIIPLILLANVFLGMYVNISVWFKITGKLRYGLYSSALGALITLVINVAAIPTYGYYASAWATLICYASMSFVCYFWGKSQYPIPYKWGRVILYGIIVAIFYKINKQLTNPLDTPANISAFKLFLCILGTVIIYLFEKYRPLKFVVSD